MYGTECTALNVWHRMYDTKCMAGPRMVRALSFGVLQLLLQRGSHSWPCCVADASPCVADASPFVSRLARYKSTEHRQIDRPTDRQRIDRHTRSTSHHVIHNGARDLLWPAAALRRQLPQPLPRDQAGRRRREGPAEDPAGAASTYQRGAQGVVCCARAEPRPSPCRPPS